MNYRFRRFLTSRYFYHYLFWIIILFAYVVDTALLLQFNALLFFINFIVKNGLLIAVVYLNLRVLFPYYFEKKKYILYTGCIVLILILATLVINVLEYNSWEGYYLRLFEKDPESHSNLSLNGKKSFQTMLEEIKEMKFHLNLTGTRKFILDFLTVCRYLVISVLLKFIDDFFNQRDVLNKIQVEKKTAELNYLKAQVNPHFLFNTLNNIYGLTMENPRKASETILKLSDMMKYMLSESDADTVLLSKDLENLKHYIEIERLRLREVNNIHFEILGLVNSQRITPHLLLPLVENAFKHGTSRSIDGSFLHAILTVEQNVLSMLLKNNIPGKALSSESLGIGIQNVRKRLELFYKDKYNLNVKMEGQTFMVNLNLDLS